jgi:Raf kinase inhibitor-like YbhB/YbcL family protein
MLYGRIRRRVAYNSFRQRRFAMIHRIFCLLAALLFLGLLGGPSLFCLETRGGEDMKMEVKSTAFQDGAMIPKLYTCDGQDISPPLSWSGVPPETKSIALIMDDPDAPMGTWVHWTIWNISPETTEISEDSCPEEGIEGMTSSGMTGYRGPCPPSGTHRYFFKLYALDKILDLKSNSHVGDMEKAIEGHIIEKAELIGLYSRK